MKIKIYQTGTGEIYALEDVEKIYEGEYGPTIQFKDKSIAIINHDMIILKIEK